MINYDKLQVALAEEFAVLVTSDNGTRWRRQPAVPEQTDAQRPDGGEGAGGLAARSTASTDWWRPRC
jgi:hypothetical protein